MNNVFCLAGTSATGKSTRIYSIIKFFDESGEKYDNYFSKDFNIRGRIYRGNILFIGHKIKKNYGEVWQGIDSCKMTNYNDFMCKFYSIADEYNIVGDTYTLFKSSPMVRPLIMKEKGFLGKFNMVMDMFVHRDFKTCKERIENRNEGRHIITEKSPSYRDNEAFYRLKNKIDEEIKSIGECHYSVDVHYSDEDMSVYGTKFLKILGMDDLIQGYVDFSKTFPLLNSDNSIKQMRLF